MDVASQRLKTCLVPMFALLTRLVAIEVKKTNLPSVVIRGSAQGPFGSALSEPRLTREVSPLVRLCKKMSDSALKSEKTRFFAAEPKATSFPSPETLTPSLLSSAWVPSVDTLTRVITPRPAPPSGVAPAPPPCPPPAAPLVVAIASGAPPRPLDPASLAGLSTGGSMPASTLQAQTGAIATATRTVAPHHRLLRDASRVHIARETIALGKLPATRIIPKLRFCGRCTHVQPPASSRTPVYFFCSPSPLTRRSSKPMPWRRSSPEPKRLSATSRWSASSRYAFLSRTERKTNLVKSALAGDRFMPFTSASTSASVASLRRS